LKKIRKREQVKITLVTEIKGQCIKHLITQMKNHPALQAKAMIREEKQADFFHNAGAETVITDLEEDIDKIAKAAVGCDAVVFVAGSGPHTGKDKTILVDLDGAVKSIEAAKRANVKRFIMISSFDTTREAIQSASDSFAPYVVAKHYADEWVSATNLQHTIIHPGRLTNDEGTGKIEAASTVERNEVSREDIAEVILTCLENNHTIGKEFQVVKGNTPI